MLSMWSRRESSWREVGTLEACPPRAYGFLGEHWEKFDPVGACTKGIVLLYSRNHKATPRMTTTGYVMIFSFAFGGGGIFELDKIK